MHTNVVKTGFAPVHGGELYYETLGEGTPMLLIHAGVADHRMWDDQFYLFSMTHKVVRYDTRGFGKSRTDNVEFSNRQDILDLMNHLGIDRAHLIATRVAVRSPRTSRSNFLNARSLSFLWLPAFPGLTSRRTSRTRPSGICSNTLRGLRKRMDGKA